MAEESKKFTDGSISREGFVALLRDDIEKNVTEVERDNAWVARGKDEEQRAARRATKTNRHALLCDRTYSATRSLVRLNEAVSDREMAHAKKAAPGTAYELSEKQRGMVEGLPVFGPRERRERPKFQPDDGKFSELY